MTSTYSFSLLFLVTAPAKQHVALSHYRDAKPIHSADSNFQKPFEECTCVEKMEPVKSEQVAVTRNSVASNTFLWYWLRSDNISRCGQTFVR